MSGCHVVRPILGVIFLVVTVFIPVAPSVAAEEVHCQEGESLIPMGVYPLADELDLAEVKKSITYPNGSRNFTLKRASKSHFAKLDVCVPMRGEPRLVGVTYYSGRARAYQPIIYDFQVEHLDNALFGQPELLDVKIVRELKERSYALWLRGHKVAGDSFVSVELVERINEGPWGPIAGGQALVGTLKPGDPLKQANCSLGDESKSQFEVGGYQFELGICTFLGGGNTTGFTIFKTTVTGSFAAADKVETVEISTPEYEEGEEPNCFVYGDDYSSCFVHHNEGDKIRLNLPSKNTQFDFYMNQTGNKSKATISKDGEVKIFEFEGHILLRGI